MSNVSGITCNNCNVSFRREDVELIKYPNEYLCVSCSHILKLKSRRLDRDRYGTAQLTQPAPGLQQMVGWYDGHTVRFTDAAPTPIQTQNGWTTYPIRLDNIVLEPIQDEGNLGHDDDDNE